jgi:hypothetical protein
MTKWMRMAAACAAVVVMGIAVAQGTDAGARAGRPAA